MDFSNVSIVGRKSKAVFKGLERVMKKSTAIAAVTTAIAAALTATPAPAIAATGGVEMYRLYNPNSGEHFYTANANEKNSLASIGWRYEGVGWKAPAKSNTPVHRLYNPNSGDHHYTTSTGERDNLVRLGWRSEGIGWYSDDAKGQALYRQYNPNAATGSHNYTCDKGENDSLVRIGWNAEGIGWYGLKRTWVPEKGHYVKKQTGERFVPAKVREYTYYECKACGFHTESRDEASKHQIEAGNKAYKTQDTSDPHYNNGNFWAIPREEVVERAHSEPVYSNVWVVDQPGHWE